MTQSPGDGQGSGDLDALSDSVALALNGAGLGLYAGAGVERVTIQVRPLAAEHLLTWEGDQQFRALHEAAHCVIGTLLGLRVTGVDIKPRMYSAAQISIGDDDQPECERGSVHLARIVMLLAGSAMERLVLGESTTGGMRDLHTATDLAIERFDQGMDLDAPYVALSAWQHPAESLVEAQASSVVRTLADARSQAEELVREHRDQVIASARLLYEARTLSGTALADALRAADVDPAEGGARTPAERP